MTNTGPFQSLLVPYDGSDPARAALTLALALTGAGGKLTVLTVVDESPVIAQSASTVVADDPTALFEALDQEGRALLRDAVARAAGSGVTADCEIVHDTPLAGILRACETLACDLIVMGTHARSGLARTFLGSTTEGVLRSSDVPVLTVRAGEHVAAEPFGTLLIAIDDSDACDGAVALAGRLAAAFGSKLIAAHATDTARIFENAATYGFDPGPFEGDAERESANIVARALEHAAIPTETIDVALVDGPAAEAILAAAHDRGASAIVMGSHGRRGLDRMLLGSVAENVVRHSPIPVLVVRRHPAT